MNDIARSDLFTHVKNQNKEGPSLTGCQVFWFNYISFIESCLNSFYPPPSKNMWSYRWNLEQRQESPAELAERVVASMMNGAGMLD